MRFVDVRFTYLDGGSPAVDHLDFDVPASTITVLTGPSGAGKSTTVDLMLGLLTPDAGRILVDGASLQTHDLPWWRSQIAYVRRKRC